MFQLASIAATTAIGVGKSILDEVSAATSGTKKAAASAASNGTSNATSKATSKAASAAGTKGTGQAGTPAEAKARKTATDFERMFLEQSMDRLTASEATDGPLGENGTGGGVYRSMLSKEYANQIVQSGGVGIADTVYREMMKMQEGSRAATN